MKSVYTEKTCTLKINQSMKSVYTEKKTSVHWKLTCQWNQCTLILFQCTPGFQNQCSQKFQLIVRIFQKTVLYIREIAKGFKLSAFRNLKTEICRLQCTYGLAYQDFKLKVTFCILLAIIESSLLMRIELIVWWMFD